MIALETILEKGFLRRVHDDIRKKVRASHLPQSMLVKDPTLLSDYQYELDDALRVLRQQVEAAFYRPAPFDTIRAAKASGLRRPLTFLPHDDAILISALTVSARNGIRAVMDDWVSFGRSDADKAKIQDSALDPESGNWFREWIAYMGLLKVIEKDDQPYLVVSDIANFFPSLDLETLRTAFNRGRFLDDKASDVLFYTLEQLMHRDGYGARSHMGLPQDSHDASRVLAHFYLAPLDERLREEGKAGRYTRWVDDIAVSVRDEDEGAGVIARIQDSLGDLGLAPNTVKTRVITKQQFRDEHFEHFNGFLDLVHNAVDLPLLLSLVRRIFHEQLRDFLKTPNTGHWSRVMRRFYTESRRLESGRLSANAMIHLANFPGEAPWIFDYLSFRPERENARVVSSAFEFLRRSGRLYDDVQILLYEWLLTCPFPKDQVLRSSVMMQAFAHLNGAGGYTRPCSVVQGLIALTAFRFGGERTLPALLRALRERVLPNSAFVLNAVYVLNSSPATSDEAWRLTEHLPDRRLLRLRRFISAIRNNDKKAVGIALSLCSVATTEQPRRQILRGRALPMLYFLRSLPPLATKLGTIEAQNKKDILAQSPALRDSLTDLHLGI